MINFECAIFCIFVKFLRVVNLIKGRGVSLLVHDPVFSTWNFSTSKLLNYFSVCKFIIDRTFWVEIITKNFRNTRCISGFKSFTGRGGGRVIYLGILSNMKIFRKSFTQDKV